MRLATCGEALPSLSARVTLLRLGPGGWIASIELSGAAAELAVTHGSLSVGDQLDVLIEPGLITEFEAGAR